MNYNNNDDDDDESLDEDIYLRSHLVASSSYAYHHHPPLHSTVIYIIAGRVIGTRGVVIQNIQRETKTMIKALDPVGNSLWIAVVIIGR